MSFASPTPTLTPSRSPTPSPRLPVQPDHFYGAEDIQFPPSPHSDGKGWLDPKDDPLAHRGIPVFRPTMEEFEDFEAYVTRLEVWGEKSGIVKVIPPKEWTEALPPLKEQLAEVKIKTPIEQHMLGRGGLFRQENMEKRKVMSVREWAELCAKDDFRAPGVHEVGLHARGTNGMTKPTKRVVKKKGNAAKAETKDGEMSSVKQEPTEEDHSLTFGGEGSNDNAIASSSNKATTPMSPTPHATESTPAPTDSASEPKQKKKRTWPKKEERDAALAARHSEDSKFLETFEPHEHWLPPNTTAADYTREYCQALERRYWRNLGLGKPAWYGADTQGSLYTDATTSWNVAHLPSTLSRILPASNQGLPGVNTPYLYFGMWRATFAWHVEDMDLFSINYIHFGAPKFWYAIPQGRSGALEQTMRGYFPKDTSNCPQFLRHKSFLASPTLLAQSSCRPNYLVQHAGEFVITFPRGYHAGFNLGFNCAESVNFALDSWLELGRKAKACQCIPDSVRIDVDQLLRDRAAEAEEAAKVNTPPSPPAPPKAKRPSSKKENIFKDIKREKEEDAKLKLLKISRKRKSEGEDGPSPKKLKIKVLPSKNAIPAVEAVVPKAPLPKLSLKLGPRPAEPEAYPCCLCISMSKEGLLPVYEPPIGKKDAVEAAGNPKEWFAHEFCASIVPETWVDETENANTGVMEKVVFGVDGIVKDRWNLKCSACTKNRPKAHGAPIQCTKGKCPKAFHVSCARDGAQNTVLFNVVREVEKEVVLVEPIGSASNAPIAMEVDTRLPGVDDGTHGLTPPEASHRILKVIKKLEVQVLCPQHNPAVAAAKKASKMDRIKAELLSYPSMTRIKIRVSAGVFEVSLIRVIEETGSVEVLWDRGVKREFKWGSVVFGNTEGPVQQRPSEMAPEPVPNGLPVQTYASVNAATASAHGAQPGTQVPGAPTTTGTGLQQYGAQTAYPYPPHANPYDFWYQNPQYGAGQPATYGYYGYNPYAFAQPPYQHPGQTQWQQAYQQLQNGNQQTAQPNTEQSSTISPAAPQPTSDPAQPVTPPQDPQQQPPSAALQAASSAAPGSASLGSSTTFPNLAALSNMPTDEVAELLKQNPQLRDFIVAALGEAQKALQQAAQ